MSKPIDKYICLKVGDAPALYFPCYEGTVWCLDKERFLSEYPNFMRVRRASVRFPCRHVTPNGLIALMDSFDAGPCAYIPKVFGAAMAVADTYEKIPQRVIRLTINMLSYYIIQTAGYVIILNEPSFYSRKYDMAHVSMRDIKVNENADLPRPIQILFAKSHAYCLFHDNDFELFEQSWELLKGENMPTAKKDATFIAYKALMLFDDGADLNKYDRDVFIWNSVDGVKRINFRQYLDLVEAPHSASYKLAKVCRTELSEFDESHYDAIKSLATPVNGDKRGTIYMCFRALWYVATKEMMPAQC